MIINSPLLHLLFKIECSEEEEIEATEIALKLVDKLRRTKSKGINQGFKSLAEAKEYLENL
jgi:hypothetical protein